MSKNNNGFENIQKILDQSAAQQLETDKRLDKNSKLTAETDKRLDKNSKLTAENSKAIVELRKSVAETTRSVKELRTELGGLGNSVGDTTEELFFNSIAKSCKDKNGGYELDGVHYNKITPNVRAPSSGQSLVEIDIVLVGDKTVAMIEVKAKARKRDLDDLLEHRYPRMRGVYAEYDDTRLYLAALKIDAGLKTEALHRGVSVLQLSGDVLVTSVAKPN